MEDVGGYKSGKGAVLNGVHLSGVVMLSYRPIQAQNVGLPLVLIPLRGLPLPIFQFLELLNSSTIQAEVLNADHSVAVNHCS
jgi:hypothetical protein